MTKSIKQFSIVLVAIVSVPFMAGYFLVDNWRGTMVNGDSSGYYFHVVSLLVNQDVGDYTTTIDTYLDYYPQAGDPREDIYGVRQLAGFYGRIPGSAQPDWAVRIHVWNGHRLRLYLDDFVVLHYRAR